jgi:hypothetical protein
MLLKNLADKTPFEMTLEKLTIVTVVKIETHQDGGLVLCFHRPEDRDGLLQVIRVDSEFEVFVSLNRQS